MGKYDGYWYYEPAAPKSVKGGIKAQRSTKGFAQKWWGRRWIQVLESFNIGARLSRGKSYARRGQVMNLDIGKGAITAKVQGTRSTPYKVRIDLNAFSEKDWELIIAHLVDEPVLAVQLLGNEMPDGIEEVFRKMKKPLFPERLNDLKTDCSCPDWSNPCKHIAAVYYLMAEAFDEYPFLLFRLRGIEMDEFLKRLRGSRDEEESVPREEPVPLPIDADSFWHGSYKRTPLAVGIIPPAQHAQLPLRLGMIPFWRSETSLHDALLGIYSTVSREAMELVSTMDPSESFPEDSN